MICQCKETEEYQKRSILPCEKEETGDTGIKRGVRKRCFISNICSIS